MSSPEIKRKLAAIMFTDIAGYTEQMSKSESKSLDTLEKKRSILKPLLKEYNGTFVKEIGDGTLSYFESAVNAATCAVKLQEETYDDSDMNIRAGIHIGDIVFKDGDVFGGGVNVASRLESIAPSGGVCVSKTVYEELSNQEGFDGVELGLQSLKGVGRLVEVFGLKGDKLKEPNPNEYQNNKVAIHSGDEVPSIAIIPFDNKGAKEDVFYAYGISADLISDCSGAGLIRVASLKDVEKIDYSNMETSDLSKKLLVRYIAQGTLWKMGDMFQLSVELYDTKDKKVVWSDRWQEKWDSLSSIKSILSNGLLKALNIQKNSNNDERLIVPKAYELYLKAYEMFNTLECDLDNIKKIIHQAIEIDKNFVNAKIYLSVIFKHEGDYDKSHEILDSLVQNKEQLFKKELSWAYNVLADNYKHKAESFKAIDLLKKALEIDFLINDQEGAIQDCDSISAIYHDISYFSDSLNYINKSLELNKKMQYKNFYPYYIKGAVLSKIGLYDEAIENEEYAIKLINKENLGNDDIKAKLFMPNYQIALINLHKGLYDEALKFFFDFRNYCTKRKDKRMLDATSYRISEIYLCKGEYKNAFKYMQKADFIINKEFLFEKKIILNLILKKLGKKYNIDNVRQEFSKIKELHYSYNYHLYNLLDDREILEEAYKQLIQLADDLNTDESKKFLSYPIPKAIVEEWEKVKL